VESSSHNSPDISELESLEGGLEERNTLAELVKQHTERQSQDQVYFSVDVRDITEKEICIDVYGIEGYDMPAKTQIRDAVGTCYGWNAGYKLKRSEENSYRLIVTDWE